MWDDDERKGEGETRCRLIACSSRKAPRGPPGLTSPADGRIAFNSTICLLNIHTAEGYISSPPRPKVENFQMKIYYPAGDRTPDLLNQRQTCYHLSQHGELMVESKSDIFSHTVSFSILILILPIKMSITPGGHTIFF